MASARDTRAAGPAARAAGRGWRSRMEELRAAEKVVKPTGTDTIAVRCCGGQEITGRFDPNDRPQLGGRMILTNDITRACRSGAAIDRLIRGLA